MSKRYKAILVFLLLIALSILSVIPVMAGTPEVWESYIVNDDANLSSYGVTWFAQTFTTGTEAHSVTSVRLLLLRVNSPGTITVSIRATAAGVPLAGDLTSGTINGNSITTAAGGSWYDIPVTSYGLSASTVYAIVVRANDATATDYTNWRADNSAAAYADGQRFASTNGGATWSATATSDTMFEVWGEHLIAIDSANAFRGYLETNDYLFTAEYHNTYAPYYPSSDVTKYFYIQLRDSTGATVIAQTICQAWGNKPASIYISALQGVGLTPGSAYRIYIYSDITGTPAAYYSLTSLDWRGTNLAALDSWTITTAHNLEIYYGVDFVTFGSARTEQLNEEGGAIFLIGIPGLSTIRPNLFSTVANKPAYTAKTFTGAWNALTTWDAQVGPEVAGVFNTMATYAGLSDGRQALAFLLLGIYILCAVFLFGTNHVSSGLAISFPFILIGAWLRAIDIALVGVLLAIFTLLTIWSFWWSRT